MSYRTLLFPAVPVALSLVLCFITRGEGTLTKNYREKVASKELSKKLLGAQPF